MDNDQSDHDDHGEIGDHGELGETGDHGETDHLLNLRGENFHQGLGGKLPHRIVLDRTSGQV